MRVSARLTQPESRGVGCWATHPHGALLWSIGAEYSNVGI